MASQTEIERLHQQIGEQGDQRKARWQDTKNIEGVEGVVGVDILRAGDPLPLSVHHRVGVDHPQSHGSATEDCSRFLFPRLALFFASYLPLTTSANQTIRPVKTRDNIILRK